MRFCLGASKEEEDKTEVFVFTGDAGYLRLPESALRCVASLAAQDECIAEEALSGDEDYDWQQVGNVLTEMVDHGILVHVTPTGG
jgi:hypothetical protein